MPAAARRRRATRAASAQVAALLQDAEAGSSAWWIAKDAIAEEHTIRITHESEDDAYAEFRLRISNRAQL